MKMKSSQSEFKKFINLLDEREPAPVEYITPGEVLIDQITDLFLPKDRVGNRKGSHNNNFGHPPRKPKGSWLGGLFSLLIVAGLFGACGGPTTAVSTEVVEQELEYADGVVMAVENVGDREYVMVVRVKGGVSRVGFVDDGGSIPIVGDTVVVFREKGGGWRYQ